jgi:cytochrome c5
LTRLANERNCSSPIIGDEQFRSFTMRANVLHSILRFYIGTRVKKHEIKPGLKPSGCCIIRATFLNDTYCIMNAQSKTLIAAISLIVFGVIPGISIASNADDIERRVQKVGKLNISGTVAAPATAASETASGSTGSGEAADPAALYQASCFACHGTGAAGAPVLGDVEAWTPRIAQGEATLLDHAINGLNAMPPRGGSTLTDEEIELIVAHIITNSQ